jgi:hypothetical protein
MQTLELENPRTQTQIRTKHSKHRGVFERIPGSGEWWIRYSDSVGRKHREKAGSKSAAINLYRKRKMGAFEGKKLPEKLRRASVLFEDIARDVLEYSKREKRSHDDVSRMERVLGWFRGPPWIPLPRAKSNSDLSRESKTAGCPPR